MSNSGHRFTIHNDKFTAVLTGQTTKIFHRGTKDEIARFKNLKYAYRGAFNPAKPLLLVKSTQPWLAFYCLDTMTPLRKIKVGKPYYAPQDGGFCFTHDGQHLLNIEAGSAEYDAPLIVKAMSYLDGSADSSTTAWLRGMTHLVKYDCNTFEETQRFFGEGKYMFKVIERHNNGYLLAGLEWVELNDLHTRPILALFDGEKITKIKQLSSKEFEKISAYSEVYYQ